MSKFNFSVNDGELQVIQSPGTRSFRYERTDPELPFVMMLSTDGGDSESYHSFAKAKVKVSIDTDPKDDDIDTEAALGAAKGVANWTEVLLQLIENTDCNPDDEGEFNEILMAAGMFLKSYRDIVKK